MTSWSTSWFGPESWGAPICRDCPRCDIPVGAICLRCEQPITENDHGITMPFLGPEITPGPGAQSVAAFHLDCHLKSVLPHAMWKTHGLTPTQADGAINGKFACQCCGVKWDAIEGWS